MPQAAVVQDRRIHREVVRDGLVEKCTEKSDARVAGWIAC